MSNPSPDSKIGYAEFGVWYDALRSTVLEPALKTAEASLRSALTELLSDRDLARITSTSGRVKSKRRTWRKINLARYEDQIQSLDDVVGTIDDLVGLRVTCINLRDIGMIEAALEAVPRVEGTGLWLDPDSERDYVTEPKESGYRGWHVNLGIEVGGTPVVCELQVRTLLQDSWGELTHEESYSKDGALPPLVNVLSTRMADLLAILDDIAEDLRTELDRIDQELVAEHDDSVSLAASTLAGQAADAAALLRSRWTSITRPTDLAGLAWALQREFGAEISDDWFGHRSFKRFLRHAVPEGEISTGRQAYLLPADSADRTHSSATEPASDGVLEPTQATAQARTESDLPSAPEPARQLRRIDREFPLLDDSEWPILFGHLSESWRRVKPADLSSSTVNRLTRSARDLARDAGTTFSRRKLDYVVKALLSVADSGGLVEQPQSDRSLAAAFARHTIQRMVELRIIERADTQASTSVEHWIVGPTKS